MSPARDEVSSRRPFSGPSGRIFDDALSNAKTHRNNTYVTNLCNFFISDNDLYGVPQEIMEQQRARVFAELDEVKPNCLLVMGGDTLDFLCANYIVTQMPKRGKYAGQARLFPIHTDPIRDSIVKWRGSIFEIVLPSGRKQKCVAAMHPAFFIRGQWKWLPLYRYIDVPRAVMQSSFPEMKLIQRTAITGPSFRQACEWLQEANQQEEVFVDYEGMSHITCLGSGWTKSEAMCIPLTRVGSPRYFPVEQEVVIWRLWTQLMENPLVRIMAQNRAYEWIKSWGYGIYPSGTGTDPMHLHHCLYPDWGGINDEWTKRKRSIDNPGHGLALIISQYTDIPYYKDDGRHWRPELGEHAFWRYNCIDVFGGYEAAKKMQREAEAASLWDVYVDQYDMEFEKYLQMEWDGIAFNTMRRDEVHIETEARIAENIANLEGLIGMKVVSKMVKKGAKTASGTLNLASDAQVKAFVQKKGYRLSMNRKTGAAKLDKDDLAALYIKHNDASLNFILKIHKDQDFIDKTLMMKLGKDGRAHCHWRLGGTNGTRLSSSESILGCGRNFQNFDRQGPARSLFLPS